MKKKSMKKIIGLAALVVVLLLCVWNNFYKLDKAEAAEYATENALSKSHCCCAWFVMRALQQGGCPIGIYPAWAYKYVLPLHRFDNIDKSNYVPQKGDVVVIENSKEHFWGHIAIYNGRQWVSDFKQKSINPYRKSYPYEIFRFNH